MPKKNIHPEMQEISIVFPSGKEFKTMSTYKKSDKIHTPVAIENHIAWTGKRANIEDSLNRNVRKFQDRISSLEKKK